MTQTIIKLALFVVLTIASLSCIEQKQSIVNISAPNSAAIPKSKSAFFPPPSQEPLTPTSSEVSQLNIDVWKYLYNKKNILNVCEKRNDFFIYKRYPRLYRVNEREYIVELVCYLGGYNVNYQYFLYQLGLDGFEVTSLDLDRIRVHSSGNDRESIHSIGGVRIYNSDQHILTIFSKSRGIANCGAFAQYQWKKSKFDLIEYRYKSCDGTFLIPEQYPQIYPQLQW